MQRQLLTRFTGNLKDNDFDAATEVLLDVSNQVRFTLVDYCEPENDLEAEYLALIRREREIREIWSQHGAKKISA